jgi:misacylated tRNA(Ala) deacylase
LFDPSIRNCESAVLESGDGWFIPGRTCFFAEGGGLPSDRGAFSAAGTLGEIINVQKTEEGMKHFTAGGAVPAAGESVSLSLDWEYCHLLRRYHTALHVLCATIWKMYGVKVTGAQVREGSARMDFGFPEWKPEYREAIEREVNAALSGGAEVKIYSLPADDARKIPDLLRTEIDLLPEGLSEIRIVEIVGVDLQADGGAHVRNLSEVGRLAIKKVENKGKGFRRLEVELD